VNEAGARIVRQPRERLLAGTVLGIWPGTGPEGVFADYVRVLETGEPFYREILYEHDELVAGLTLTIVRIGAASGAPDAEAEIGVTFADITARLRAERERERLLAESEAARAAADLERRRLSTVLEQLPVGVTLAEAPSGQLLLSNAAVRRIWGLDTPSAQVANYSADYVGYHTGPTQTVGRPYESHEWPLARALTRGETVVDEVVEIQRPDGTRRRVSISAAPVRDAEARVVGGVVISLDVTERERLQGEREQALAAERAARTEAEAARGAAEAANRAKSEFLAVMSHELRTPLNAIGGYAELMEMGIRGPVTEAQRDDLGRIQRSQRHLLGLVNEVLNYAKLETGSVRYDVAAVDVAEALAEAEGLVAPQARAKGLTFAAAACAPGADGRPLTVRADAEKVRQVLVNLLSNAVKFTDPGGRIAVACDAPPGGTPEAHRAHVRIAVRDSGIGIPADKLEAIFEPFVQVRSTLTRTAEGTGLGLAISRDLARGMGGDLTAESTPGVGSTFTLTLPAA
jgi:PAS domain S-box-containing protein